MNMIKSKRKKTNKKNGGRVYNHMISHRYPNTGQYSKMYYPTYQHQYPIAKSNRERIINNTNRPSMSVNNNFKSENNMSPKPNIQLKLGLLGDVDDNARLTNGGGGVAKKKKIM